MESWKDRLPGILTAAVALVLWRVFFPGLMSQDSILQYGQALTGHYNDWQPPLLRGSTEQFREAIGMVFDGMRGPLPTDELARVESIRRPDQTVVLGTWKSVLESSTEDLDASIVALTAAVRVPYLSLHGIDPGPGYAAWLHGLIPQAIVEVWADHGHYPHLVDTSRFLSRLGAFEREVGA